MLNEKHGTPDKPVDLKAYQDFLAQPDQQFLKAKDDRSLQTKIIQKLIHRIEILPDRARVHYRLGESCLPGRGSAIASNTVDSGGGGGNRI